MLSLPFNQLRNGFLAAVIGVMAGFAFLILLPKLSGNAYLLFGVPVAMLLLLIMVVDIQKMVLLVLFSRALIEPLTNLSRVGGSGMGIGALMNLFIIFLGAFLFLKEMKTVCSGQAFKSWAAFLFISFVAIGYSCVRFDAVRVFLNYISYFVMFVIPFAVIKTPVDKKNWIKILIISAVAPLFLANMDLLAGGLHEARVKGTFSHPNVLAFYLVLVISVIFYVLKSISFKTGKGMKFVLMMLMLNAFILLLATKTRSAWVAAWLVFMTYGILRERKYLFLAVLLPLAIMPLSSSARERVGELFGKTSTHNSLNWRLEVWESTIPEIKKSPVWGYGLASFIPLSQHFSKHAEKFGIGTHNVYLQIAFEMGLVGLFLYLMLNWNLVLSLWKSAKLKSGPAAEPENIIVLGLLMGYLFASASDNMLYYLVFNWYFFFFVGVVLAGSKIASLNKTGMEV